MSPQTINLLTSRLIINLTRNYINNSLFTEYCCIVAAKYEKSKVSIDTYYLTNSVDEKFRFKFSYLYRTFCRQNSSCVNSLKLKKVNLEQVHAKKPLRSRIKVRIRKNQFLFPFLQEIFEVSTGSTLAWLQNRLPSQHTCTFLRQSIQAKIF